MGHRPGVQVCVLKKALLRAEDVYDLSEFTPHASSYRKPRLTIRAAAAAAAAQRLKRTSAKTCSSNQFIMSLPTHRQCSIEIQNKTTTFTLCNPRMHIVSGSCSSPLPPTLSPYENGNALFTKKPHTACGSVTVFTYDLQHVSTLQFNGRVAVMFSVPYDFNFYSNWYAVGVFDMDKACDQHLYDEMYNKSEQKFVRGKAKGPSLTYRGAYITVRATMSDTYQPILKVAICNN